MNLFKKKLEKYQKMSKGDQNKYWIKVYDNGIKVYEEDAIEAIGKVETALLRIREYEEMIENRKEKK